MSPLKVLLAVHQFFPRFYHGTERYTLDLATELVRAGHDVVILTANQVPADSTGEDVIEYEYSGVRVLAIDLVQNGEIGFSTSYARPDLNGLFAQILLSERPDVIHCTHLLFLGVSFLHVARHTGRPLILTMTDFFGICWTNQLLTCAGKGCAGPDRKNGNCLRDVLGSLSISHPDPLIRFGGKIVQWLPFMTPLMKALMKPPFSKNRWYTTLIDGIRERRDVIQRAYSNVDHFIVATSVLERKYRQYALKDGTISKLPFGITQPTSAEFQVLRSRYEKLRSTDRPLVFGFIGQISRHKGVDLLARAFANVRPLNTELHIIGNLQQDPALGDEVRAIASGISAIKFFPPFPSPEIYSVLSKIDVLVLPSIWSENAPLVLLNGLASRTFVATSDGAGMTEFVEIGKTGLIFRSKSTRAIEKMLNRAVSLRSMLLDLFDSHPGYEISPSVYAERVLNIYAEELNRAGRSWNERVLNEVVNSGPHRVRPVKWSVLKSCPVRGLNELTIDWQAVTAHNVAIDEIERGRFRLKTLSQNAFLLFEKPPSAKVEFLVKWLSPVSSAIYYKGGTTEIFSENRKVLLPADKETWIRLLFNFDGCNEQIQAFRWDLAHNSIGIELEVQSM
jgi:glycosyltransferase involved in cell wall biosynthesis